MLTRKTSNVHTETYKIHVNVIYSDNLLPEDREQAIRQKFHYHPIAGIRSLSV